MTQIGLGKKCYVSNQAQKNYYFETHSSHLYLRCHSFVFGFCKCNIDDYLFDFQTPDKDSTKTIAITKKGRWWCQIMVIDTNIYWFSHIFVCRKSLIQSKQKLLYQIAIQGVIRSEFYILFTIKSWTKHNKLHWFWLKRHKLVINPWIISLWQEDNGRCVCENMHNGINVHVTLSCARIKNQKQKYKTKTTV